MSQVDAVAAAVNADEQFLQMVKEQLNAHRQAFADMQQKRIAAKVAVTHHRQLRNKTVKLVRKFCNHLKAQKHYTPGHGIQLNMIGQELHFDEKQASPRLRASVSGQRVVVKYNKPRGVSGIRLYCKRGSETSFTLVDVDAQSPCYDQRPNLLKGQPEERQYFAEYFYSEGSNAIGQRSPVLSVLVNL